MLQVGSYVEENMDTAWYFLRQGDVNLMKMEATDIDL